MITVNETAPEVITAPCTEKMRSLLRLQKALREEFYEGCAFWVQRAMASGATKKEVSWLVRHPSWNLEEDRPQA